MKICTIKNCFKKYLAKGFCTAHYAKYRKYGDPNHIKEVHHYGTTMERFLNYVEKTNTCWNWKGSKNWGGYGRFSNKNKAKLAHRISYEIFKGKIPKNLFIDHLCRNRACVNPSHLEVVTQQENIRRGLLGKLKIIRKECSFGHSLVTDNMQVRKRCKICRNKYEKERRKQLKYKIIQRGDF